MHEHTRSEPEMSMSRQAWSVMSLATSYFDSLLAASERTADAVPDMVDAAERCAARLVGGGDLYVASARPDFVSEAYIRSGGLMMLRAFSGDEKPCASDVVIVGWSGVSRAADCDLIQQLKATQALVVGIGPACDDLTPLVDLFLHSDSLAPGSLIDAFVGEPYPVVSLHNLVLLWAFTGELVAALTRRGQMPAMFQSVLVPGARARNEGVATTRFHRSHAVPPIAAGELAAAYLDEIGACLRAVRDREVATIGEVADACAEVMARGRDIWAFLISHFPCHQAGAPGDPGFMRRLSILHGETPDLAELEKLLQPGDLFFFLGYYRRPVSAYELARRRGCPIVEVIAGTDKAESAGPLPDYVIQPGWPYRDALVAVPGYDISILPASGIMQTAVYWGVVAEIAARSTR